MTTQDFTTHWTPHDIFEECFVISKKAATQLPYGKIIAQADIKNMDGEMVNCIKILWADSPVGLRTSWFNSQTGEYVCDEPV